MYEHRCFYKENFSNNNNNKHTKTASLTQTFKKNGMLSQENIKYIKTDVTTG